MMSQISSSIISGDPEQYENKSESDDYISEDEKTDEIIELQFKKLFELINYTNDIVQ